MATCKLRESEARLRLLNENLEMEVVRRTETLGGRTRGRGCDDTSRHRIAPFQTLMLIWMLLGAIFRLFDWREVQRGN
jgi:hypothetical protein